jgi:hypothetical protein
MVSDFLCLSDTTNGQRVDWETVVRGTSGASHVARRVRRAEAHRGWRSLLDHLRFPVFPHVILSRRVVRFPRSADDFRR